MSEIEWPTVLEEQRRIMEARLEGCRAALDDTVQQRDAARAEVERLRERNERLGAEILKARAEAHELVKHRDPNINSALRDLAHARAEVERLRKALCGIAATKLGGDEDEAAYLQHRARAALAGSPSELGGEP